MKRKRTCRHCHRLFIPVHNPQQQFCSRSKCQNVRKSAWRREKHKRDSDYRENQNQNQACKWWRKKNPEYWKHYRATHSPYTEGNRYKQRQRKQAFYKGPEPPHPNKATQFANSDALIVKISFIPKGCQQRGEVCKHTTL